MGFFQGLLDGRKRLAVLQICLKDELTEQDWGAIGEWTISNNGVDTPIMADVLKTRELLSSPVITNEKKDEFREAIVKEVKSLSGVEPAELPIVKKGEVSEKTIIALRAYTSTVALKSYKAFAETINAKNPMVRRGIGSALYEIANQAVYGKNNYNAILRETFEGAVRGGSEVIIEKIIPKEYQKTARVMAQGAIRASFFAIANSNINTNSLMTAVLGAPAAAALSNFAVTKLSIPEENIDIINKAVIKSTIDALSAESLTTGIYSFFVSAARDKAFNFTGGVSAITK